jgi:hypothetical protein
MVGILNWKNENPEGQPTRLGISRSQSAVTWSPRHPFLSQEYTEALPFSPEVLQEDREDIPVLPSSVISSRADKSTPSQHKSENNSQRKSIVLPSFSIPSSSDSEENTDHGLNAPVQQASMFGSMKIVNSAPRTGHNQGATILMPTAVGATNPPVDTVDMKTDLHKGLWSGADDWGVRAYLHHASRSAITEALHIRKLSAGQYPDGK